jgi:hypothetical protein
MDNPSEMRGARTLLKAIRVVRPLLSAVGVKLPDIDLDGNILLADGLLDVQSSFTDTFASRGWIAHGGMNHDASLRALRSAKMGDFAAADDLLADSFNDNWVHLILLQLGSLKCFAKRVELAKLAAEDYSAQRYHACIPLVLMLLDGMGQELLGASFLRQGVNLAKRDSFLEVGPGLCALIKTMTATRPRTNVKPIDVPFRHGILHGVDLGYANRIVAAKCWGALHAAGTYAHQVENPKIPKVRGSLREALRNYASTLKDHEELRKHLDAWKPRERSELVASLADEPPRTGTPERCAFDLLLAWKRRNFGQMAQLVQNLHEDNLGALAGRIRENLGNQPSAATLLTAEDDAPGASSVVARLSFQEGFEEDVTMKFFFRSRAGDFMPRTLPGGSWQLLSLWPLEAASLQMQAIARGKR